MAVFRDCYLQISADASNWADLSTSGTVQIPAGAGLRPLTYKYPYGSDTAIIVGGKRPPLRLIVTYNYTDATVDNTIRTAYEAKSAFYVRFAPRGNATGNFLYTSSAGIITTPPIPEGERHSGTIVLNRFTFETPGYTKSTIGVT